MNLFNDIRTLVIDSLAAMTAAGEIPPGLDTSAVAVELPRDPAQGNGAGGPQYLYASNGKDYKLLADGVSLTGGTNVEVLGVRIDPSKQNTMEKAAFGFWTEAFATV